MVSNRIKGLSAGIGAYLCWGMMPLYWKLFGNVGGWEVIAHRVIWSLLLISVFLLLIGRLELIRSTVKDVVHSNTQIFNLCMASFLAAVNWWINVYAVNSDQVIQLGTGMFLTPLMTLAFGVVFFKERLNFIKQLSVYLPCIGVGIMIYSLGTFPWISLGVSSTWALYAVFKKRLGIDPWVSNALEASMMAPFALAFLFYLDSTGAGNFLANGLDNISLLLISVGLVTSIPMIAFAASANYLPLTLLGFIQYLNPLLTLLVGLVVFKEPFHQEQLLPLMFIWSGILLFIYSEVRQKPVKTD